MSKENVVAESWEDADADPVRELMEKVEKVKLLQRQEEQKEAFFEKVKAEESVITAPKMQVEEGLGPAVDEPKRVFLRRPKDGFSSENVVESSPSSTTSTDNQSVARSRSHHKPHHQKDQKQPAQTYEERQAAYQAARNRILGTEYKPDNQEIKEIKFIDRSKSPETLKMTEKNMVEHYGEELSRELMQQPAEAVSAPDAHFVPDFSQPPPCLGQTDGSRVYNGPSIYPPMPQNFHPQLQQQFMENPYYMMNGQVPVQYVNHNQMQYYMPQDPQLVSSAPQPFVDEHAYYYGAPQPPMGFVPNTLPNMAYPPPNFPPQVQPGQQMGAQMNPPHMVQMQQSNGQRMNQFQMPNGVVHGSNPIMHGAPYVGGIARGQNRQQQQFQGNVGLSKPPPLMSNVQDRTSNRNGGNGQRAFQQQPKQQTQFTQNQNYQNTMNNGRKQACKNGRNGQKGTDNPVNKNSVSAAQPQIPVANNPIPFGCPPRYANAIREQQANNKTPNTGDGLLGAHPMMAATQWPSLSSNMPQ